jgi:DNA helicase-2/ATP-dependent DNA helicase PcrA
LSKQEIELNDAQLEVVWAGAEERLLVVAGAGQGKTEVVVSRIDSLVQEEGLTASEEILVLSFSRAAVSAVRTRLDLRDVSTANVRTFDSFASFLLLDAGIQSEGSFETRIRRATQLLKETKEVPHHVGTLRHVIIDEVQDLVGDRADFVLALLKWLDDDAGITALGDPLQGVYDFQLEESLSKTNSDDVIKALVGPFGCKRTSLGNNYRARGKLPKQVVSLGNDLRETRDGEAAEALLEDLLLDVPDRDEIKYWYGLITPAAGKKTAVLCTTNADVLRVSRYLNERSVSHAVRRQAQDFGAARWIAGALGPLPGPKERRSVVEAALERLLEDEADLRWAEIKSAEGRSRDFDSLDLLRMNRLVRARALPLPLTEPDLSSVIVSTIHRAKGLEFDSVFLVEPTWQPEEDAWTRVRREYVALSRARDNIFKCQLPQPKSMIKPDARLWGRFTEEVFSRRTRGARWTRAIEFQYGDIEAGIPASSRSVAAPQVQRNLQATNRVGVKVHLEFDEHESTDSSPSYLVVADDGALIGRTSASFDDAFAKTYHWLNNWPGIVDGLSLVSVETVAGEPREAEAAGLGSSGLWLVPRVTGLARPDLSTT